MIDFSWTECTRGLSLFFVFIYLLFVVVYYKKNVTNFSFQKNRGNFWMILFALLLILIVAASNQSDWFSYQRLVKEYDFTPGAFHHTEPIYGVIIRIVNRNYLLFRIVVWGGAFLLVSLTLQRFEVNPNISIFFIISAYLLTFNYARATLAMAFYFYGLSFLIKPIKGFRIWSLLLMAVFFFCAYSFHHSLLALVFLTIMAYMPLNKPYMIVIMLIALPFIAMLVQNSFAFVDAFEEESLSNKLELYSNVQKGRMNLFGLLRYTIQYGSFYVPIVLDTIIVMKHYRQLDRPIIRLHRVMLAITVFSLTFLFMGLENQIMYYRFLYMTFIPIVIISVYLLEHSLLKKRQYTAIVLLGMLNQLYTLLYAIYFQNK